VQRLRVSHSVAADAYGAPHPQGVVTGSLDGAHVPGSGGGVHLLLSRRGPVAGLMAFFIPPL
jgi:hypothetical protein